MELFISVLADTEFPSDELLDASNSLIDELQRRTGKSLDSGGGRYSRDIWLPTSSPDTDRHVVAEAMAKFAPHAVYTVKLLED